MSDIYYQTFGEGDIDILLVHGWASSSLMWDSVRSHIKKARLWAFDFQGHGKTPTPEQAPTIDEHVRTMIRFCDEQELKPQMIIAHSTGGLITLKTMSIRPDLAQQLVLISPVVTGRFGVSGIPSDLLRNEFSASVLRATEKFWPLILQEYLIKLAVSTGHGSNPTLVQQITDDFLATDPRAGIETLVSMTHENMQPYLTDITQPTLVCVGKGDLTVPFTEGKTAATYMPNAELVIFDELRHRPMDEDPEGFGKVFKEFLGRFNIT